MGSTWSEFDECERRKQERVVQKQERLDDEARHNNIMQLLRSIHAQRAMPVNLQNQIADALNQNNVPQGFQAVVPLHYNPIDLLTGDELVQ